ncbi:hypothetical protein IMCC3135_13205 [Granulosicoccus antarcticus IMCC3135]|uniref:Uncharacterized protein n=1 Tax=Granulosicoccus antarcticus IMCC3135 TaxID=1192854 RepID=A0A2Z2NSK1_9GAMM|nr:hypothetical protein IMCC3135_13205 [Granulosicoccus antarcticus IMCC3135]
MSCAETENISSRVNVTIMLNTTFNTLPVSYRKSSYSLRSAQASAFGARSRGIGFIDFSIDNTGLLALVVEHCLEAGPACVKRRLGHRGFCQLRATDISHVDLAASIDQIAAEFMQGICSAIPDFCVNRPGAPFASCPLGLGKLAFQVAIPTSLQHGAIAAGGNGFQTKIDTYTVLPLGTRAINRDTDAKIPSTASILSKTTCPEPVIGKTEAVPYLEVRTCKEDLPVLPVSCPSLEGHPPQRAFIAKTLAPPQLATLCRGAFAGVVFGSFLNRTATNVLELLRRTNRVSREVKSGHPPTTLPNHTIRQLVAVVPYLIDFSRHAAQKRRVAIFYPDFENFDAC